MSRVRLIVCVLLPFAAGYYLSYLFRSINALIAADLTTELGLNAADLGLLTSVYFLLFAAVQLPCGVVLDRYGPRIVDSALLLLAAAGSILFAVADSVVALVVGRALIGLGVAVGLMAGLKAIVLWFPPERVALANGCYIMLGALGALSATGPAETVVQTLGWRGLFAVLAVASAAVALLILLVVPEKKQSLPAAAGSSPRIGFLAIYRDRRFWRIAPLAALGVGTSFSLQGLWAAPWLTDVAGLGRGAVVEHLTLMATALAASALLLGALAERLRRAGIPTELFLAGTLILSMAAQLALLFGLPVSSHVLFAVIAAAGSTTVLSFAVLAQYFPKEVSGRANAALGVLNMGTAFGLQCLSGFIVALWPVDAGRYPAEAHQAAMATGLALQLLALVVFIAPRRRSRSTPMAQAVTRALGYDMAASAPAYTAAVTAWTQHVRLFRTYAVGWRLAACAAALLCVALSALLSTAVDRAAVALYVFDIDQVARLPAGGSPLHLTEPVLRPVVQAAAFSAPSLPAFGHSRIDDGATERLTAFALAIGASLAAWAATAPAPVPTATVSGFLLLLTMLTAILVVADRRTDARSRRAWARLDLASGPLPPHQALVIDRLPDGPAAVTSRARLPARADIAVETGPIPLAQPGRSRRPGCRRRRPPRTARVRSGASGRAASVPRRRGSASLPGIGWQPPAPFAQADDALLHGSLVVRDDLGYPVPIAAGELDAIETYLDPVLRDLLVYASAQRKDDG
jgi:MFS family permease